MKKRITLLLVSLLISALAVTVSASNKGKTYLAPYGTPTVDGAIDNVWYLAPWAETDAGNQDSIIAKFKVLHDDTYVYFLVQFTDTMVVEKMNECVQIWLHEDNCELGDACDHYTGHLFQINGILWTQVDDTAPGNGISVMVENYVVVNDGAKYTYEISMKLHNGIPEDDGVAMEVVMEDYNTNTSSEPNGWIRPRAWNLDMSAVENSTYAYIAGGNRSLFVNCSVDTYRYGFVLGKNEWGYATCAVSNATWITNKNFYTEAIQAMYPRTIFYSAQTTSTRSPFLTSTTASFASARAATMFRL